MLAYTLHFRIICYVIDLGSRIKKTQIYTVNINILQNIKIVENYQSNFVGVRDNFQRSPNTVHVLNTDTNIETGILWENGETVPCIKFWFKLYLLMSDFIIFNPDIDHWLLTTNFLLIIPFLFSWFKFCHLYPTVSFSSPAIFRSSPAFLFSPVSCIFMLVIPAHFKESWGILLFVNYAVVLFLSFVGGLHVYKSISFY